MEQQLSKQNMDALSALAETNMKISEAKNTLFKLQQEESDYIREREVKTLDRIQKLYDESELLVKNTTRNNKKIHDFCNEVTQYALFLEESHRKFKELVDGFNEKSEMWDKVAKKLENDIAQARKVNENDRRSIEMREKEIEKKLKLITKEKALIESKQAELAISYEALRRLQ